MRPMNGSVGWSDAGVLLPYRLWKKYGDQRIIETYYEPMRRYAKYMISRTGKTEPFISVKTGLSERQIKSIYTILVSIMVSGQNHQMCINMCWKDFATSRPEEATAYLSYIMGIMVEIAELLGHTEDIPLYAEYRDGAKNTYRKLMQQAEFSLDTDRQARLVRPLYFDLLDEKGTAFAKKRLIQALDQLSLARWYGLFVYTVYFICS